MIKTQIIQMAPVGSAQAISSRPSAVRSRSDSLNSATSMRPAKRARSSSSNVIPARQQTHEFQSVIPAQTAGQDMQLPNDADINSHGVDMAPFGINATSFMNDNIDPALRAAIEGIHRSNTVPDFGVHDHNTSASPTVEELAPHHEIHDHDLDDSGFGDTSKGKGRGKRNSTVEDNEQELKRLARENDGVPLGDLATRVRGEENGPHAEKTRQVFGMAWLTRNCEKTSDKENAAAVPRNRVYARYVSVCANEKIKPLNPASFGKLVRLIFPDIKTRRLGVRGQSKYHYCGIRLLDESGLDGQALNRAGSIPATRSETPILGPVMAGPTFDEMQKQLLESHSATAFIHDSTFAVSINEQNSDPEEILRNIVYFPAPEETLDVPRELLLPNIHDFAPHDTDADTSATLTALYRSHCASLLEAIRFLQVKKFFQLFISFQGTLTAPVQKLFAEPGMAQWIQESDWTLYQEMIRMLAPHALSVVPASVLTAFRDISDRLPNHLRETFSTQPPHVLDAKLVPATIFSSLLDRMLRVNDAAHASARILSHPPDRELMRRDWESFVQTGNIVKRELPCRAPEVERILSSEITKLLFAREDRDEDDSGLRSGLTPEPEESEVTTETILDHWVQFLSDLPSRFPKATARTFMLSVGAVATACLRDITMAGGEGFGGWWVIRCWVDEWIAWTAERSGFLKHTPSRPNEFDHSILPELQELDLPLPLGTEPDVNVLGASIHPSMDKRRPEDRVNDDSGISGISGISAPEDLLDDVEAGPERVHSSALDQIL